MIIDITNCTGLPRWCSGKESSCQCRRHRRCGFSPWVRKIPWSRKWQPAPVFLPGKFHGQYSCLENSMDRGAWQTTVPGVAKSRTWPRTLILVYFVHFNSFFLNSFNSEDASGDFKLVYIYFLNSFLRSVNHFLNGSVVCYFLTMWRAPSTKWFLFLFKPLCLHGDGREKSFQTQGNHKIMCIGSCS